MSAAPSYLSGDEGDSVFVRADLAATETKAREWLLAEGTSLDGYDADLVEMLPVPEHFTGFEYEWAIVRDGTPDAVRYWRFRA